MLILRSAIIADCGIKNFTPTAMLLSLHLQIIKVASCNSDKNNPELYCITLHRSESKNTPKSFLELRNSSLKSRLKFSFHVTLIF